MPIVHISDTARWVAYYRAMESDRPDALFRDPFARRLAGPEGEQIVNSMKRGRRMAWAMIVRTVVFDELVLEAVTSGGVARVVNLAAGLDARPWRMMLPSHLEWIDVDLPDILDYKRSIIGDAPARCGYRPMPVDLTNADARRALVDTLSTSSPPTLFVTEGLLIYLTTEDVGALARDLHQVSGARLWLIDLANPRLLGMMNRSWGKAVRAAGAPFRFAPAEGTAFFEPFGWRERVFRSSMLESRRLGREMPMMWLWRPVMRLLMPARRRKEFHRMAGFVVLERVG
jgi:methyltransferase (TIGR00027 family)